MARLVLRDIPMSDTNPHDSLVRNVLSSLENAEGELRAVLPQALCDAIDWRTLRLENSHFVDSNLKDFESDLLFTAKLKELDVVLYVLFEHQSTNDGLMAYRVLCYMVKIWDWWLKNNNGAEKLPPIVPVVMSHAIGGWTAPTSMHQVIAAPEELLAVLKPYLPDFMFVLDDLMQHTDAELTARTMLDVGKLALLLLRHGRGQRNLLEVAREWAGLFRAVWNTPNGAQALRMLVRYMSLVKKGATMQDMEQLLDDMLGAHAHEVIMVPFEQDMLNAEAKGKNKGREEGRDEGEATGRATSVLAVAQARGLEVPDEARKHILSCTDIPTLDRWIVRAVKASSIESVFEDA